MLKIIKTSGFAFDEISKDEILQILKADNKYNGEVAEYVFNKYMMQRNDDSQSDTIKYRYA